MLSKEQYDIIHSNVLLKLRNKLPKILTYHTVQHTIDILRNAERIAHSEKIRSERDLYLLRVACLYHDSGFLVSYQGHEEESCKLAKKELPGFGITAKDINIICGLIMATKIPQTPLNKLEEIICDADLDYLGTEDFLRISNTLFLELKKRKMIHSKKEWNMIQVNFLKKHRYFTATNKKSREQQKLAHLKAIESML